MAYGHKGDFAYESTNDPLLEFFSKAGSLMKNRGTYHGDPVESLDLFKHAWDTDNYKSMQLALWLRDCRRGTQGRAGAGNRSASREALGWIAENHPAWIISNIQFIPEVGRWDDLLALMNTPVEGYAIDFWVKAIKSGNGLAAKWAPREKNNKPVYHKLRKAAGLDPKSFRKLLAENTKVVETLMCNNSWEDINYSQVPSVAMARSVNAFTKHDSNRFQSWKDALKDPNSGAKVNAEVLFPHDCIRTLRAELGSNMKQGFYTWSRKRGHTGETYEDSEVANAQFAALPNYMEGTNMRLICICDFSGSMDVKVSGSIAAIDVSMAMGLYCSDRVGKDNPFYRKFIPFSDNARLVDWKDDTFSVAVQKHNDGWCGSTNVSAALDSILDAAKLFNATNDQIPNCLLMLSDMQFDPGANKEKTAIEACLDKWVAAGYSKPRIIYWNLGDSDTSPATSESKDVALVSGFSPALLTAILEGDDFSPLAVMNRAISKYEVVDPRNS
jgi:hypothetical protein